jgi:hypothetical protein
MALPPKADTRVFQKLGCLFGSHHCRRRIVEEKQLYNASIQVIIVVGLFTSDPLKRAGTPYQKVPEISI